MCSQGSSVHPSISMLYTEQHISVCNIEKLLGTRLACVCVCIQCLTNGSQVGQLEVVIKDLHDVASRWTRYIHCEPLTLLQREIQSINYHLSLSREDDMYIPE